MSIEADDVSSLGDTRLLRMDDNLVGEGIASEERHGNSSQVAAAAPSPAERLRGADERRAAAALYGSATRSGSVAPATPRHLQHVLQHCTDPFNNDDPAVTSSRVV